MKNIRVLPTEKRSNLFKDINGNLGFHKKWIEIPTGRVNQNIYITNEEKFTRDEYITDGIEVIKATPKLVDAQGLVDRRDWRKIVLTTDRDLITDGVQSIDDEFLEWFVKNPSCESVEVIEDEWGWFSVEYKIIIPKEDWLLNNPQCKQIESCSKSLSKKCICPKEEPKQETLEDISIKYHQIAYGNLIKELTKQETLKEVLCGEANKFYRCVTCDAPCGSEGHYIEVSEKPKQETLEEVAERLYKKGCNIKEKNIKIYRRIFIDGVKWQQEQDKNTYTLDEVLEVFEQFQTHLPFHYEFLVKEHLQILKNRRK